MSPRRKKTTKRVLQRMPRVAILLESTYEISRGLMRGIVKYVRIYGPWGLHIITGGTEEQRLPSLDQWKATGIIARIPNNKIAQAVVRSGLPTVLLDPIDTFLDPKHPLSRFCRCSCDNRTIGRMAARHFLDQGFEHFAILPDFKRANWASQRFDAFEQLLVAEGKTVAFFPVSHVAPSDWGVEFKRVIPWLRKLPKPVAIFTPHDLRARQVLDACLIADIKVPHEVAVLGVSNDEQVCETTTPPLSSIAVDTEAGGYAAAQMLDGLMRGTIDGQQEFIYPPLEIVGRASSELVAYHDPVVIRARDFIRINSGFSIRVSDVARHMNLSSRSIELRFKKSVGHSVLAEIQQVRIEAVRRLVAQTDTPFGKIATLAGLESQTYLGEVFKETFGMTMSEYREQFSAHGNTRN